MALRTPAVEELDVPTVQRRTLGVLSTYQALSGIAVAGAIPAGALIAAGVGGSEAAAGIAQTSGVVGAALAALPLARLTLSGGRRRALATGVSLGALGAVVVVVAAVTRSFPLVVLGCLLVGAASASNYQARYAAADLAVSDRRARDLSIVVWASTIGAILGPNLLEVSGRLAVSLGLPQLSGPYLVAAVCLGLSALLMLSFLRPDPYLLARRIAVESGDGAAARTSRLRDGIVHVRQHAKARLGITAVAIGHTVMVMVMVMTPVHMRHVDVQLQLIGLVISVHVAGMYALSPVVGWSADRFGRRVVIGAGVVILATACVLGAMAPADDVPRLGVALFLLGLGWSCTLIGGSTLLVEDVDPADRPAVQGASDLVMNVAGAAGGIVAGIVVAAWSYALLCVVGLVPVAVLGAYVLVSLRTQPPDQGGSSPV
ncbi:MAG TPA: MFS transporter [Candidatus Nanopelagicales bacterium]|nr:MFS transporter [Candidatus Nanopelagicales bacterium]